MATRLGKRKKQALALLKDNRLDYEEWLALHRESTDEQPKRTIDSLINGDNVSVDSFGFYTIKPRVPKPPKVRKPRKTKGMKYVRMAKIPEPPYYLEATFDIDSKEWAVYVDRKNPDFWNVKACLIGEKDRFPLFFVSIHVKENRFVRTKSVFDFIARNNLLFSEVRKFFNLNEVKF